ncbi:MAG: hypothetical protein GXP49_06845 [Deltaproteobacteria bacterium]|nr:hypothetical protein [Deltaproteobacteria bacterium]
MLPDESRVIVDSILKRCIAIADLDQRAAFLRELLVSLKPVQATDVLSGLEERAHKGEQGTNRAMQAVTRALELDYLNYDWIAAVYSAAIEKGHSWVQALLAPARAKREPGPKELRPNKMFSNISLGMRRQMARKPDKNLLDRLAMDPDPGVVRRVLANPRVTEPDVVRIAAKRPANPDVLRVIFKHPKWFTSRRVKVALVRNPYTPTDIALRLLPQLMLQDLRETAGDPSLHESVVTEAKRLVERRRSKMQEDN